MKAILLGAVLLFCLRIKAQTPSPANNAGFKLFFEKTYLHTDRDVYAQGDTLWYKAYLVNGQDNTDAKTSSTLYVDLIDTGVHVIRTEIIHLTDGHGNGDFDLPDNFAPGKYRLRAYTNWMRNFGDNFIFEKAITVLNAGGTEITKAETKPVSKIKITKQPAAAISAPVVKPYTVRFYPEGGSMLEGITAIVAVKAEDGLGKGVSTKGAILTSNGDTITHFTCDTLGMGLFVLLPDKGVSYHAVVNLARKILSVDLPAALHQGLAVQIKQTDSLIHVMVSSTARPATDTAKYKYTLVVKHGGQTLLSRQIQAGAQQIAVNIPATQLPEGIASITIYDEHGKPNCERLVYIHHRLILNTTVSTAKKTYQPFEKTTLQINTGQAANLSVAVVDAGAVPAQADDINSYLMLQSEVKGNIEHVRRYFDTTNVNRAKQLDLLLMTQGWRDFIWRRMADTAIRLSYIAENGITVTGKVEDEVNHKAMPGLNISLFASGAKGDKIYAARNGLNGRFIFPDVPLYGNQNIKLSSVNDKGEKNGSFVVDTLFSMPVTPLAEGSIDNSVDTASDIAKAMVQKTIIAKKGVTQLNEVVIKENKNIVKLDNGRSYITWGLQEDFNITPKEYWTKNLTWFVLQYSKRAVTGEGIKPGPAFLKDGHRVYPKLVVNGSTFHINYELYWSMPIEKFKKVEIRPTLSAYFIFLTTKEDALIDNPGSLSADVQGYYEARTFYKPTYAEGATPKADLRTTLHWEPNLKTDINGHAELSFYNAGSPASVRVIVQGITAYGMPVSKVINYEVK